MAADLYFDTYKRYKAGTSKIVTWLAETARDCSISARPQTQTTTKVTVDLRDFTRLTRSIVNATDPAVEVPLTILDTLKDVIASRKSCSKWYQKTSKECGGIQQCYDGHAHFIEVLEDVLEILRTHSVSYSRPKPKHERREAFEPSCTGMTSGQDPERLNNIFDYLTLEEPANLFSTPQVLTTNQPPERPIPQTVYEVETSDNDITFALFCYFEDRNAVRAFVKQTWASYREEKTGLITAALTTDTAVEVVRRAEEELIESFPGLRIYDKLLEILFQSLASSNAKKFGGGNELDFGDQEGFNFLIGDFLWQYRECARSGNVFRLWEAGSSGPKEEVQDVHILTRGLTDYIRVILDKKSLRMKDGMFHGLSWMISNDQIPAWLVFACRTYVDIHAVLGEEISRPWDQLRLASDSALRSIRDYFTSRTYSCYGDKVEWVEASFAQLISIIAGQVKTDVCGEAGKRIPKALKGHIADLPPFYFMAHNPVRCGLLLFRISRTLQLGGTRLANLSGVSIACAHLYNAMIQSNSLTHRWADMDALVSYHGEERIFVGGAPTDPRDFLKRFYLMKGISIRAFSRERKRTGIWDELHLPTSIQTRRTLIEWSPVITIFQNRFARNASKKAEASIQIQEVENLLNETRKRTKDDKSVDGRGAVTEVWDRSRRLSSTQLLSILQEALSEEELNINFDYLSMNGRCDGFLQQVRSNLIKVYPELERLDDPSNVFYLRDMVRLVFIRVCDVGSEQRKRPVDLTQFRETAVLLQDIIEREGDVEIRKARILANLQPQGEGRA